MIEKYLGFLVSRYHLSYRMQPIGNYCGSGGMAYMHSFYHESGCFTVLEVPVKGEMAFYVADAYIPDEKALCRNVVDVRSISPEVWERHEKRSLFFWSRQDKVLAALAEAIQRQAEKHGACLGIVMKERAE